MVCGHGINDMPRGWASVNDKNQKIYKKRGNYVKFVE